MTEDRIYVIYRNGKRYDKRGRKIAYLTRGAAKGVITSDSSYFAGERIGWREWQDLTLDERDAIAKKLAEEEFEIVEYAPIAKEAAR